MSDENHESIKDLYRKNWELEKRIKELESHIVHLEEEMKNR